MSPGGRCSEISRRNLRQACKRSPRRHVPWRQVLGDLATKLATGATDDASLLRAVQAAGGIERVVSLAKGNLDSLAVQVQYAASVRDCCLCEELALDMGNAGGIETLIKAAQKHYDSPEVQADGLLMTSLIAS